MIWELIQDDKFFMINNIYTSLNSEDVECSMLQLTVDMMQLTDGVMETVICSSDWVTLNELF